MANKMLKMIFLTSYLKNKMITLRQLQFALAVARYRHFKKAAKECGISQAALSLGIAELEKNLGTNIFERNNKNVLITPIGEEILKRSNKIHMDIQDLIQVAQTHKHQLAFPMDIGFIPSIAPFLLPKFLPKIRQKYPHFPLTLHEDLTRRLLLKIEQGKLDAAIIALPYELNNLIIYPISEERFFLIAHPENPLANKEKIDRTMLKKAPLLLLDEEHCISQHIAEVCNLTPSHAQSYQCQTSLHTLIHMTASNMGVTLIPEMALPVIQNNQNIVIKELDIPAPHRKIALVTRPNYARKNEIDLMLQELNKSFS